MARYRAHAAHFEVAEQKILPEGSINDGAESALIGNIDQLKFGHA